MEGGARRDGGESGVAAEGPRGAGDEVATLRAELERLRAELAGLTGSAKERPAAGATDASDGVEHAIGQLVDRIRRVADDVKGKGQENLDVLLEKVKERPITSLAVAFGAGLVLSRLLRRR